VVAELAKNRFTRKNNRGYKSICGLGHQIGLCFKFLVENQYNPTQVVKIQAERDVG